MQHMEKEVDLSGWMMYSAQDKIWSWKSVILLAGESTTVDILKMLASDVKVRL